MIPSAKHGIRRFPWACPLGILFMAAAMAVAASAGPLPALAPDAGDRCPVCGMFVAKYPDWVAQVRFSDRQTVFFDGAKDFFKYLLDMARFSQRRSAADVAAVYVTDYYTMKAIDAATAIYVVGSDVYGPMGHELIAFASPRDAETFLRDHHGRRMLRFAAVTLELVKSLD